MKSTLKLTLTLALFAAGTMLAAGSPQDDVLAAATALGNAPNYSWHTTFEVNGTEIRRGPTDGKTEKGGYTTLAMAFNDQTIQIIFHGTNAVIKTQNGWQPASEVARGDGGRGFNPAVVVARQAGDYQTPAFNVTDIVQQTRGLTAGADGISGDLTEDGAKEVLMGHRFSVGPEVSNAKGSVTLWLADGKLVKVHLHVSGTISINGRDRDVGRTSTTEITDVGTTKVEVPDDARKKLEQ